MGYCLKPPVHLNTVVLDGGFMWAQLCREARVSQTANLSFSSLRFQGSFESTVHIHLGSRHLDSSGRKCFELRVLTNALFGASLVIPCFVANLLCLLWCFVFVNGLTMTGILMVKVVPAASQAGISCTLAVRETGIVGTN